MATLLTGGNADSYVKLAWAGRQEESGQLVDDPATAGACAELDAGPLDGLRVGVAVCLALALLTSAFDAGAATLTRGRTTTLWAARPITRPTCCASMTARLTGRWTRPAGCVAPTSASSMIVTAT